MPSLIRVPRPSGTSIWISELQRLRPYLHLCVGLALALPLAACLGEETGAGTVGFLSPPETRKALSRKVLTKAPLYSGRVVVAGPDGYCIDGSSIVRGAGGSVVLIASCDVLSGKPSTTVDPALITVSIAPRRVGAEQPSALDLAQSMAPAKVLASEDGDGISLIRLASGGNTVLQNGDPRYWRAGMIINGHVISIAAYTPEGSGTSGKALIMAMAENLLELSPIKDYTPTSSSSPEGQTDTQPQGLASLLGGLFPQTD